MLPIPLMSRTPPRWRLYPLAVALLLAACGRQERAPEAVRSVRTERVSVGGDQVEATYAGEVRPRIESRLGFRVAGKLMRRAVELGAVVKTGQLLAQLDPTDLKLAQDAARAALQSAQANLDQNAADFKRFKDLQQQGFISTADLERRETALKAAQAQLEQARAQSGVQGNQAGYAALVADAPGVITGIDAEPGAVLAAGSPVIRVALDGPRDVVFSVPEDRVGAARTWLGQAGKLRVRLWGTPAVELPATVREIAAAADPVTRTFLVKADVGRADVRLGQTATVVVSASPMAGVAVPMPAVFEQGGRSMVWVLDGQSMKVRAQAVQVASVDGARTLVTQGLQPGQEIVTAGVHVLSDGLVVRRWGGATPAATAPVPSTAAPAAVAKP